MTQEILNTGAAPNDGTGDKARDGAIKIKNNFADLFAAPYALAIADTSFPNHRVASGGNGILISDGGVGGNLTYSTLISTAQTLTDAATIAWVATSGHIGVVTVTADRTLGKPTGILEGDILTLIYIQDGTGGYQLSYHADFTLQSTPVLHDGANEVTVLRFIVWDDAGTLKLREVDGAAPGPVLPSFTLANLPTSGVKAGTQAYATDDVGGAVPVFYDGTNWRRVTDRAIAAVS